MEDGRLAMDFGRRMIHWRCTAGDWSCGCAYEISKRSGVMGAESAIDHHHVAHRRRVYRRAWRVGQTIDEVEQAAQVLGVVTYNNEQTGRSIQVCGRQLLPRYFAALHGQINVAF